MTLQLMSTAWVQRSSAATVPEQGDAQRRLQTCGQPVLGTLAGRTREPVGDPHCSSVILKGGTL